MAADRSRPEMTRVSSSSIEAIGYDMWRRELYVRFVDGDTYVYAEVGRATYSAFLQAESKGRFLNYEVKPRFEFRQL